MVLFYFNSVSVCVPSYLISCPRFKVFEAAAAKSDAVRFAEMREKEAEAAIRNVLESIDAGRKNKSTATNPQVEIQMSKYFALSPSTLLTSSCNSYS